LGLANQGQEVLQNERDFQIHQTARQINIEQQKFLQNLAASSAYHGISSGGISDGG
jgi:hypothetical protein